MRHYRSKSFRCLLSVRVQFIYGLVLSGGSFGTFGELGGDSSLPCSMSFLLFLIHDHVGLEKVDGLFDICGLLLHLVNVLRLLVEALLENGYHCRWVVRGDLFRRKWCLRERILIQLILSS